MIKRRLIYAAVAFVMLTFGSASFAGAAYASADTKDETPDSIGVMTGMQAILYSESRDNPGENEEKGAGFAAYEVTEEAREEVSELADEAGEYQTDPLLEAYLLSNADRAYTAVDSVSLKNAVLVKQSLFDVNELERGDCLESVFYALEGYKGDEAADNAALKFIAQLSSYCAAYSLSDASEYYLIYCDTMSDTSESEFDDIAFAKNNNDGEELGGCHYDRQTGIAYIPKKYFINDEGKEEIAAVQIQMMEPVTYGSSGEDGMYGEVEAATGNTGEVESAYISTSSFFEESVVRTEPGMDEDDIEVFANGIPVEEDNYVYDAESGELAIGISSAAVSSVYVRERDRHLAETEDKSTERENSKEEENAESKKEALSSILSRISGTITAWADESISASGSYSLSAMSSAGTITLDDDDSWILDAYKDNLAVVLSGTASLNYSNTSVWSYGYGINGFSASAFANYVDGDNNQLDLSGSAVGKLDGYVLFRLNFSNADLSTSKAIGSYASSGKKFSALNELSKTINLQCAHITTDFGETNHASGTRKVRVRLAYADSDQEYAVFAVYTERVYTQTAVGLFKVKLKSTTKTSDDLSSTDYTPDPDYQTVSYTARTLYAPDMDIYLKKTDSYDSSKTVEGAVYSVKGVTSAGSNSKFTAWDVNDNHINSNGITIAEGSMTTDKNGEAAWHLNGDNTASDDGIVYYTAYAESGKYYFPSNYSELSSDDQKTVKSKISSASKYYKNYAQAYAAAKAYVSDKLEEYYKILTANSITWTIREISSPPEYLLSENTAVIESKLTEGIIDLDAEDTPVGYLTLTKSSADKAESRSIKDGDCGYLTDENACYSLEGAVYRVYTDSECRIEAGDVYGDEAILTTDENGECGTLLMGPGTYYVKEITAAKGYMLCDGSDGSEGGAHKITVTSENTKDNPARVECADPPACNLFDLTLQKLDADTGEGSSPGTASLSGTIFALEYYQNTEGSSEGGASRTWYFQTKEESRDKTVLNFSDPDCLIEEYTTNEGVNFVSDKLFFDAEGNAAYAIGTYRVYEVSPAKYYKLSGYMMFSSDESSKTDVTCGLTVTIKQPSNGSAACLYPEGSSSGGMIEAGNIISVYDDYEPGSIAIYKNSGGKPLSGVSYKLVGVETADVISGTTDSEGELVFENLRSQHYIITEIKTADGVNLLKDEIEVTLPVEMSAKDLSSYKSVYDSESGEYSFYGGEVSDENRIGTALFDEAAGMYCFYNPVYTIEDDQVYTMPYAGAGINAVFWPVIIAGAAAVALGCIMSRRDERRIGRR